MEKSSAIFLACVDSFTSQPFRGNPAGVCILPEEKPSEWMQSVAREMNLSETAFLLDKGDLWKLRWYTPVVEVDLCGHATLASAHILWENEILPPDAEARFSTRSGMLTAARSGDWITMDFPADPPKPIAQDPRLAAALRVPVKQVMEGKFDFLAEVDAEETVRTLQPDMAMLQKLGGRGICVTSRADPGKEYDFVSRFFAPAAGIPEDPVTGSAHCMLSPFWESRIGKQQMTGFQCSARGGIVKVRRKEDRVLLGGQAVTIAIGEIAPKAAEWKNS